jgi:hypothetical protein
MILVSVCQGCGRFLLASSREFMEAAKAEHLAEHQGGGAQ